MSYLVLARKWRPQTFEEVIGQKHVTRTLQNALKNDCVAHALLFSGPRGIGKTSVARILAKAINCELGPAPDPCNKCVICREITAGSSVDVQEIDGASNRGIDEIRELRENILFRPTRCRYRIYIIDEVHMLTTPAFNALLKTLEEPPSHVYFIFATTEPEKIPVTIHSRCQHYEFRRLSAVELAEHLDRIVQTEGMDLQRDATLLLAREAEGSVRDSLSLLDQVAAYGANSLKEVCEVLGLMETQTLREFAVAILENDLVKVLKLIDEVYSFGGDIYKFTTNLINFFRNLVILKKLGLEKATGLIELSKEEISELSSVISSYTVHSLFQVLDALIKGQEALYKSTTPKLSFEMLAIRICNMEEVLRIDDLMKGLDTFLSSTSTGKQNFSKCQKKIKEIDAVPKNNSNTLQAEKSNTEIRNDFLNFVREQNPILGSLLFCCEDIERENSHNRIRLKCRPCMQYDMLCEFNYQTQLKELISKFFNHPIDVLIEETCIIRNGNTRETSKTHSLREELIKSSLVQEAIKVFNARISDVKLFPSKG
jgi:DNA polymerase-3 subunit gamma/tau